jgi:hypothetical protein
MIRRTSRSDLLAHPEGIVPLPIVVQIGFEAGDPAASYDAASFLEDFAAGAGAGLAAAAAAAARAALPAGEL